MKRILLLLVVIASSYQLKAQQLNFKPADSLLFKAPKEFQKFKLNDSILFKGFSTPPKGGELLTPLSDLKILNKSSEVFYSRMPVGRLYSNDKMPVARLERTDKMPVKKIKVVDPLAKVLQNINP